MFLLDAPGRLTFFTPTPHKSGSNLTIWISQERNNNLTIWRSITYYYFLIYTTTIHVKRQNKGRKYKEWLLHDAGIHMTQRGQNLSS